MPAWHMTNGYANQYNYNPVQLREDTLSGVNSEHSAAMMEAMRLGADQKSAMTDQSIETLIQDGYNKGREGIATSVGKALQALGQSAKEIT